MAEPGPTGSVALLRRYPVKSLLGENLGACDVTGRGLGGDRVLALVHRETGKVASAKNPRLWRDLLRLAAASGPDVKIAFPDGTAMASTDPGIHAALSEFLGHPVTLTATPPPDATLDRADPDQVLRDGIEASVQVEIGHLGGAAPQGTFFDFAPLHLLTTSTLERIAELSPRGTVELERYRPNIVIRTAAPRGTSPRSGSPPRTTGSVHSMTGARSRAPASTPRCCARAGSRSATWRDWCSPRPEPAGAGRSRPEPARRP